MPNTYNIAKLFRGKTQDQLRLAALNADTFLVDERNREDLLAFAAKFSKALSYFNPEDTLDGNWQQLLLTDWGVLTAYITQTDTYLELTKYLDYEKGINASNNSDTRQLFTQQFFSIGFHLVLRINRWYQMANFSMVHHPFRNYLYQTISEEGHRILQSYYRLYFCLAERIESFNNEVLAKLEALNVIWQFEPFPNIGCPTQQLSGKAADRFLLKIVDEALQVGQELFMFQDQIIASARSYFEESLARRDIPPHIGLLLSFIDLYRYQQDSMNEFTDRHLSFYYRDILGFSPAGAQADTTFVCIQLAKGVTSFYLPLSTALNAGKNTAGETIEFAATKSQWLNNGALEAVETLVVSKDDTTFNGLFQGAVKKFNSLGETSWPLFGDTTSGSSNYTIKPVNIGYALSCPDLFLQDGTRSITFSFQQSTTSTSTPTLDTTTFSFQLTTAKGWTAFDAKSIQFDTTTNALVITLSFKISDPPIVAYKESVHKLGISTAWPVCQMQLNTNLPAATFDFLQAFSFNQLTVDSSANEASQLVMQSDQGKLKPGTPCLPFGNAPVPVANFYFGGQELFVKPLTSLTIDMLWDKLNQDFSFKDYYTGYPENDDENDLTFYNSAFQAKLTFYDSEDNQWKDVAASSSLSPFPLFTALRATTPFKSSDTEQPITNPREIIFTLNPDNFKGNPALPLITSYSERYQSAFFKLSFANPDAGFGNASYPQAISSITLENAGATIYNNSIAVTILKKKPKPLKPLPNQPFVPKIQTFNINYSAKSELGMTSDRFQFYHLLPAGVEQIDADSGGDMLLLPQYAATGYAYLGFTNLVPETTLSLFFSVTSQIKQLSSNEKAEASFEFLTDNGWTTIIPQTDSTYGFEQSGIIEFTVPGGITNDSSLYDPGGSGGDNYYWLRLTHLGTRDVTINFVDTNAVPVARLITEQSAVDHLPAGSIKSPVLPTAEIKQIVQPVPSVGGIPAETTDRFRQRVAYRLNHKHRASTLEDMEILALQAFPSLYKVIALQMGYLDNDEEDIQIVVIAYTNSSEEHAYRPVAPPNLLRGVINLLEAQSEPLLDIQIVNPNYIEATVTATIVFDQQQDAVHLSQQLNQELIDYLSPWLSDNPLAVSLPGTYNDTVLFTFIQSRDYVISISNFSTSLHPAGDNTLEMNWNDLLPRQLVVSNLKHNLMIGTPENTSGGGSTMTSTFSLTSNTVNHG